MNKVLLQFWEESERGWGVRPDGASLHINAESYRKYLNNIYDSRRDIQDVPNEYARVVGSVIETVVSDDIYNMLLSEKNINNLINKILNFWRAESIADNVTTVIYDVTDHHHIKLIYPKK